MITHDEARRLALEALTARKPTSHCTGPPPEDVVIQDELTIERSWGWVFFYSTRAIIETRVSLHAVGGNAPLIVERESGRTIYTGTAHSLDTYLSNYESTGDPHMQLGSEVEVYSSSERADSVAGARLLHREAGISLGRAKRGLDGASRGHSFQFATHAHAEAQALCASLRRIGFEARQLPEPA